MPDNAHATEYADNPTRPAFSGSPAAPPLPPSPPLRNSVALHSATVSSEQLTPSVEALASADDTTEANEANGVADARPTSTHEVERESLLDILRDAPFEYRPDGLMDKVKHSIYAESRQAEHIRTINARFERAIALAEIELVDLGDGEDGVDPVIIELNQKGGAGKSPNATTSAATLAANNDQVVIVVDNNQVLGSTLQYVDIAKTLGVRGSMEKFRDNTTYAHVRRYLGHHPRYKNLYGIDSDPSEKRHNNPIDIVAYYRYAKGLKSACYALIFDNGNEVINAQTIVGLELSDVFRFVTIPSVNDANRLCRDTMTEIRKLYPDKVAEAVITISACQPHEMDLDSWSAYFKHPKEQICIIPYDPILQPRVTVVDNEELRTAWVVDHTQFQRQTYLANLERDILTLKQARKGIKARQENEESEAAVIERMKSFLQADADSKLSPTPALPEDADEEKLIEMLLSRAGGNPREAAARILRQFPAKDKPVAQQ